MSQRTAFILAAVLTAFALVIGGAVAGRAIEPAAPEAPAAEVTEPTAIVPQPETQADLQQVLAEREAAYQELIRQANERLQQAYDQQQSQVAATAAAPAYPVTPDQAANIALQAAPGAVLLSQPELVNFQGVMAYEVALDQGLVYVDATTGQILYNGTLILADSSYGDDGDDSMGMSAGSGFGGGGEHSGGEHSGGDDHGGDDD